MRIEKLPPIRTTLRDSDHPYLTGAWTPLHEEVTAHDCRLEARARRSGGVYCQHREPVPQPLGRYHPFDGDAMVNQLDFRAASQLSQSLRAQHAACVRH